MVSSWLVGSQGKEALGSLHKAACYAKVLLELVFAARSEPLALMQVRMGKTVGAMERVWGAGVLNPRWNGVGARDIHNPWDACHIAMVGHTAAPKVHGCVKSPNPFASGWVTLLCHKHFE